MQIHVTLGEEQVYRPPAYKLEKRFVTPARDIAGDKEWVEGSILGSRITYDGHDRPKRV